MDSPRVSEFDPGFGGQARLSKYARTVGQRSLNRIVRGTGQAT